VHGAVYVLRQPIESLLLDPETRHCRGIQTDTGQVNILPAWPWTPDSTMCTSFCTCTAESPPVMSCCHGFASAHHSLLLMVMSRLCVIQDALLLQLVSWLYCSTVKMGAHSIDTVPAATLVAVVEQSKQLGPCAGSGAEKPCNIALVCVVQVVRCSALAASAATLHSLLKLSRSAFPGKQQPASSTPASRISRAICILDGPIQVCNQFCTLLIVL